MIELIGAGMPRTGTLTQKVALERLGLAWNVVRIAPERQQERLVQHSPRERIPA